MKVDFQWPPAIMYCVTLLVLGFLVFKGLLHPEALLAQLTWLAPSPLQQGPSLATVAKQALTKTPTTEPPQKPETD